MSDVKCTCFDLMGVLDGGEHFPGCPAFKPKPPKFPPFEETMTEEEMLARAREILENPKIRKKIEWNTSHLFHWSDEGAYDDEPDMNQRISIAERDNHTVSSAVKLLLYGEKPKPFKSFW
jgi:hypothetical protein